MRESDIEKYLKTAVAERGGEIRKVKWIGRNGAPDRRILGKCWVEVKAPGKELEPHQAREIARMRAEGEIVHFVDSLWLVDMLMMELYGR